MNFELFFCTVLLEKGKSKHPKSSMNQHQLLKPPTYLKLRQNGAIKATNVYWMYRPHMGKESSYYTRDPKMAG